jgi:N-acyl homoserine lactone hydrolase
MTGPWTDPLPIIAWAIEHEEGLLMVDTGERADARDSPFARFDVGPDDEVGPQMRAAGLDPADVQTVVITHLHGDHMNGLGEFSGARVLLSAAELRYAGTAAAKLGRRLAHSELPESFAPEPVEFEGPPLGAFDASHAVTRAGDVAIVPTPGHTPGHASVIVVEDDVHRLLAGDCAYDQQQMLDAHPDGVSPKPAVARETMQRIARHAQEHPTVFLPTHDPGSSVRLEAGTVVPAG